MSYTFCGKNSAYICNVCGKILCPEHTKIRTVCTSCLTKQTFKYRIETVATDAERNKIQEFVLKFWGEEKQFTFDKEFAVASLPTYSAKVGNNIVGFVSFSRENDAILIVALGILPNYQNAGVGKSLIGEVEVEARKLGKKKVLVSTSNDNLPALAFYQALGFQIYEVKPNVIAEKHGMVVKGIGGLPVRDELRLQKLLSNR